MGGRYCPERHADDDAGSSAIAGNLTLLLFIAQRGQETVFQAVFTAGGDAGHAADAVGVPHEVGVGDIDVHGAGAVALFAAAAFGGIALNAEDTQHAPQALASAACAEVVAEWALDEQANE